jgi:hypothetical protein
VPLRSKDFFYLAHRAHSQRDRKHVGPSIADEIQ